MGGSASIERKKKGITSERAMKSELEKVGKTTHLVKGQSSRKQTVTWAVKCCWGHLDPILVAGPLMIVFVHLSKIRELCVSLKLGLRLQLLVVWGQ